MTRNVRIVEAQGKWENVHGVSAEMLQRMAQRWEPLPVRAGSDGEDRGGPASPNAQASRRGNPNTERGALRCADGLSSTGPESPVHPERRLGAAGNVAYRQRSSSAT